MSRVRRILWSPYFWPGAITALGAFYALSGRGWGAVGTMFIGLFLLVVARRFEIVRKRAEHYLVASTRAHLKFVREAWGDLAAANAAQDLKNAIGPEEPAPGWFAMVNFYILQGPPDDKENQ